MIVLDNNALVFLYRPAENQEVEHQKMQYIFDNAKKDKAIFWCSCACYCRIFGWRA